MNQEFSIRRRIEIDAAHRVPDHGSKCFNIHGHRYVIEAEVCGTLHTTGEEKGMVADFGFIKQLMIEVIHDPVDHGMIWYSEDPLYRKLLNIDDDNIGRPGFEDAFGTGWKNYVIDVVPTAENLAMIWFHRLNVRMERLYDSTPYLKRVYVHETPNCVAWYPSGVAPVSNDQTRMQDRSSL